ncbi:MAG TPA: hypothetical protein VEI29_08695, partial [Burkholderiaceae bacterium]|nr:hypothetical protein [Burkholderiaceae bacterium]
GAQAAVGDRHVYAIRSRFLTPATLVHFELIAWPSSAIDTRSTVAAQGDTLDLTAQMRAMWR